MDRIMFDLARALIAYRRKGYTTTRDGYEFWQCEPVTKSMIEKAARDVSDLIGEPNAHMQIAHEMTAIFNPIA